MSEVIIPELEITIIVSWQHFTITSITWWQIGFVKSKTIYCNIIYNTEINIIDVNDRH
jgi:hypothetical protein